MLEKSSTESFFQIKMLQNYLKHFFKLGFRTWKGREKVDAYLAHGGPTLILNNNTAHVHIATARAVVKVTQNSNSPQKKSDIIIDSDVIYLICLAIYGLKV